jgi:peptide/nickel transport system permease protein
VTVPAEQLSPARASAPRLPPSAIAAIALLGTWIVLALAAAWIAPYDPDQVDLFNILQAPSTAHWFGTDQVGRDVLSRIIYGARVDLMMCVLGVVPALVIGTTIGLVSGYYGGLTDALFMRIYDITVAFPFFVLVLAIVGVLGPGLTNYFIALALVAWVTYARIVRAEVLVIRQSEYVLAARVLGYPTRAIIFRHMLPNALSPVAAYSMTDAILVILAGASLGFLGMGAQPPTAEWGVMIADGQPFVQQAWWICLFPGLALISLGLGLAFLGDALGAFRRRLD